MIPSPTLDTPQKPCLGPNCRGCLARQHLIEHTPRDHVGRRYGLDDFAGESSVEKLSNVEHTHIYIYIYIYIYMFAFHIPLYLHMVGKHCRDLLKPSLDGSAMFRFSPLRCLWNFSGPLLRDHFIQWTAAHSRAAPRQHRLKARFKSLLDQAPPGKKSQVHHPYRECLMGISHIHIYIYIYIINLR